MTQLETVLNAAPVIPVVVIEDARHAVPLARALVAGGIPAIEVTLRTPAALEAVRAIAAEVEGAIVGVGTVRKPQDLADAHQAGARFAVSPGSSPMLLAAAKDSPLPWLPGAATASEVMTLAENGLRHLKFFPAESVGGVTALRSLHGPLPEIRFCATGGIGVHNARDYLAAPNVSCVGLLADPGDAGGRRLPALALCAIAGGARAGISAPAASDRHVREFYLALAAGPWWPGESDLIELTSTSAVGLVRLGYQASAPVALEFEATAQGATYSGPIVPPSPLGTRRTRELTIYGRALSVRASLPAGRFEPYARAGVGYFSTTLRETWKAGSSIVF